jgi:hypothetical protein
MIRHLSKILFIVLAWGLLLLSFGCSQERRIVVLTDDPNVLIPLKASQFTGFFNSKGVELQTDAAPEGKLISFLNFTKYNAVITEGEKVKKIKEYSDDWLEICPVAVKTLKEKPIRREKFYLLIKKELLQRPKLTINLIKGWNFGVYALKDPAVVFALTGKENLQGYRFLLCAQNR